MSILKQIKDNLTKIYHGTGFVPRGLFELSDYFRLYGPIHFKYHKEGGEVVAVSQNFRHGSIVTSGKNQKVLDANIRDAILTAFDLPDAYRSEAKLRSNKDNKKEYALA